MKTRFSLWIKIIVLSCLLTGCGTTKIDTTADFKVRFLDEYVIPADLMVDQTKVGGLSDLDYDGTYFYAICDLPSSPRIYVMDIVISDHKIDTIRFEKTIKIDHRTNKELAWDSEGLLFDTIQKQFIVSTEGSINRGKDPFIATVDTTGQLKEQYQLPSYFLSSHPKGPRNNGVFEGLSFSVDGKGIWTATELPLKTDGTTAKLYKTHSPIRITYFNPKNLKAEEQFAYPLGRIRKLPFLPFGINGVSALLAYAPHKFLVLERAFSAGHGSRGFRARLYEADAQKANSTLEMESLRKREAKKLVFAEKKLIFDFNSVRKQLTNRMVDNLEGISFGPILPNGNPTLLVISDNNFSSWTRQLNQVILLELIPLKKSAL